MRRFALAVALSALAFTGSCKESTAPPRGLAGIYELMTVDGEPLPVVLFDDAEGTEEMLSGHVDLFSNGTFSDITRIRTTVNGSTTEEDVAAEGTYRLSGSTVTFDAPSGAYTMELDGTTLTQDWNGFILVYQKVS
ncbi:MAG: hypothetical protein WD825_14705 [Gemmatimonadaceae bacterium]